MYTFNSTGETKLINRHIDSNSKNVIYTIQCNHCHKQYTGETKRRLKDRFKEHRNLVGPVDKLTTLSLPQYPNIFCVTVITLLAFTNSS